ncbi:hypothetical protein COCSADRAFT_251257 [Bipolaris sorokiniana ND90Pr]|uniref:Uncharacterized protein n=1 Tax=Cochliobolus sativus (strain ND90Pr / ATCC 201652) TaxID=665912 RepID=M2QWT9_COCSN|nr:uncharacterized protein COCSADRAFT_251257 [Bipolaris sorokiniana ND90Pr]EMD59544.1 hypothetical protein COCSADRAFT_251257 [Bipolaris sorokiniana ND90Pr]
MQEKKTKKNRNNKLASGISIHSTVRYVGPKRTNNNNNRRKRKQQQQRALMNVQKTAFAYAYAYAYARDDGCGWYPANTREREETFEQEKRGKKNSSPNKSGVRTSREKKRQEKKRRRRRRTPPRLALLPIAPWSEHSKKHAHTTPKNVFLGTDPLVQHALRKSDCPTHLFALREGKQKLYPTALLAKCQSSIVVFCCTSLQK